RPAQYRVVRSGIELERFRDVVVDREDLRRQLGIPRDALVAGSGGRLSEQKAPLDMIAAFERLAAVRPDAHLVLVGDGPLQDSVRAAAARSGLAGRVHLTGMRRDVAELLRDLDVCAV